MSDGNPPETAGNRPISDDRPSGGYGEGSASETCLGCARKVPDDATWRRDHAEECGDACWCRAYCWTDGHCEPNPADIAARARAEAFEECARIAEEWGAKPSPWGWSEARDGEANAVAEIAAEIRRRAKR